MNRVIIQKSNHSNFLNMDLKAAVDSGLINLTQLCRVFDINKSTVRTRLASGKDLITALTEPLEK